MKRLVIVVLLVMVGGCRRQPVSREEQPDWQYSYQQPTTYQQAQIDQQQADIEENQRQINELRWKLEQIEENQRWQVYCSPLRNRPKYGSIS